MPVIGKPDVEPFEYNFKDIRIGHGAYLEAEYVTIVRYLRKLFIFIDLISPVIPLDEMEDEDTQDYVKIVRIGSGLTQNDFEIDFSDCSYSFHIYPSSIYLELTREKDLYVIFSHFKVNKITDTISNSNSTESDEEETLESLQQQLGEAINAGNDEGDALAIELTNKINALKDKKLKEK